MKVTNCLEVELGSKRIEELCLYVGPTVTLWLSTETLSRYDSPTNRIQLEVRLNSDGKIKLFCAKQLDITTFGEWKPIDKYTPKDRYLLIFPLK